MKKGGANLPCTWGRQTCLKKKKKDSLLKHFAKERSEVYVNFMMEINC